MKKKVNIVYMRIVSRLTNFPKGRIVHKVRKLAHKRVLDGPFYYLWLIGTLPSMFMIRIVYYEC
ncbi:hypothetical protein Hanom_Chr07g00598031 [Helianthus anomalus]